MSKVRTFSRAFPSYHPKKGQPTFFIEKINKALGIEYGIPFGDETEKHFASQEILYNPQVFKVCKPKYHTIRAGHHFKPGDKFSPRVWSGDPYKSKQVIISPDITVEKTWAVQIESTPNTTHIMLPTDRQSEFELLSLGEVATNDGLSIEDFIDWFNPKRKHVIFKGQIICWNKDINY